MIGLETAARVGYFTKGAIYGLIGILAVKAAVGSGDDTSGSREAIRTMASGPFGRIVLIALVAGLAGYVVWRGVQAVADPGEGSGGWKRLGLRAFYLASALLYGLLALYALQLLLGTGGDGGESASRDWTARLMGQGWGQWVVGAIGLGIIGRGIFQFVRAYTASFRDDIRSYELRGRRETVAIAVGRVGLTARGVVFSIIGGFFLVAAIQRDPSEAQGLSGALATLRGEPLLLGAMGAGLVCYALYQWVKARYRMIDL